MRVAYASTCKAEYETFEIGAALAPRVAVA
jgi:hypothetical protein